MPCCMKLPAHSALMSVLLQKLKARHNKIASAVRGLNGSYLVLMCLQAAATGGFMRLNYIQLNRSTINVQGIVGGEDGRRSLDACVNASLRRLGCECRTPKVP